MKYLNFELYSALSPEWDTYCKQNYNIFTFIRVLSKAKFPV
jgi:hypothetical protein